MVRQVFIKRNFNLQKSYDGIFKPCKKIEIMKNYVHPSAYFVG
jgi:hypothetical protein